MCWIQHDGLDFQTIISAFVASALTQNEKVLYCTHSHQQTFIRHAVQHATPERSHAFRSGQIEVADALDWFYPGSKFSIDGAIGRLDARVRQALAGGHAGLRVCVEMSALQLRAEAAELFAYEAALANYLSDMPCIVLCQYSAASFPHDVLADAAVLHSSLCLAGACSDNPFYTRDVPSAAPQRCTRSTGAGLLRGLSLSADVSTGHAAQGAAALIEQLRCVLMLQRVLDAMTDGAMICDPAGQTLFYNAPAEELLGETATERFPEGSEGLGWYCADEVTALPHAQLPLTRAVSGECVEKQELFYRSMGAPSGRWLRVSARLFGDRFGAPAAMLIFHDITQEKKGQREQYQFETRVREAQKLESLGVLAGGIAHDFNNMLAGILGNASLLRVHIPEDSPLRKKLDAICTTAQRASELTGQLLTYSGKGAWTKEEIELTSLIEEMRELLGAAVSKKAALHVELGAELPPLAADAAQLRQLVLNLVTNASESLNDRPGNVVIRTGALYADRNYLGEVYPADDRPEGLYLYLEVEDNGSGMTPATVSRIFEPFFTTKFVGRGLGLAAVLGIVRRHSGGVLVKSHCGKGTVFRVLFPALEHSRSDVPEAGALPLSGTALVIDDEDGVRAVVQDMLETFGFTVFTAANGADGVRLFERHSDNIDIVLLDVTMPDINGGQACREIKRIRQDAPVVLMSGYHELTIDCAAGQDGPTAFLQKPYTPDALLRTVLQVCRQSSKE